MTKIINLQFSWKNKFHYNCNSSNSYAPPALGEKVIYLQRIDYIEENV